MANEEHLAILKQGVEVGNKWRIENAVRHLDFNGANFRGAELGQADINRANLIGADLTGANLSQSLDTSCFAASAACGCYAARSTNKSLTWFATLATL